MLPPQAEQPAALRLGKDVNRRQAIN